MSDIRAHFERSGLAVQHHRLLELLTQLAYERREVTLSSGKRSDFYVDCRQVSLHAEGHFLIGQLLRAAIEHHAPTARAVGGMTLGADPLVSATSMTSFLAGKPLHGFLIRKEAKGHGTGQFLEGTKNLRPGMPAVIVEDTITTGGSLLRAIERARQFGLDIVGAFALVDRGEGGRQAITAETALTSLYEREDFPA